MSDTQDFQEFQVGDIVEIVSILPLQLDIYLPPNTDPSRFIGRHYRVSFVGKMVELEDFPPCYNMTSFEPTPFHPVQLRLVTRQRKNTGKMIDVKYHRSFNTITVDIPKHGVFIKTPCGIFRVFFTDTASLSVPDGDLNDAKAIGRVFQQIEDIPETDIKTIDELIEDLKKKRLIRPHLTQKHRKNEPFHKNKEYPRSDGTARSYQYRCRA